MVFDRDPKIPTPQKKKKKDLERALRCEIFLGFNAGAVTY